MTSDQPSRSVVASKARSVIRTVAVTNLLLLKQLWVWPILAAVFLGTIGWFLRSSMERELQDDLASELQTILDADVTALKLWLRSQENTVKAIADDPDIRAFIHSLADIEVSDNVGKAALAQSPDLAKLREQLKATLEAHGYAGFIVLNQDSRVIASMRDDPLGLTPPDDESSAAVRQVLDGRSLVTLPLKSAILLPDAEGNMRAGVPTMFAMSPVMDGDEVIAALGLRIRPEDEFTEILGVARAGESGETYAFNRSGRLLSQSRFDDDLRQIGLLTEDADSILNLHIRDPGIDMTVGERPTLRRSEQPLTRMAADATAGHVGVDVAGYRDYRGVPVVGAWTWLHEYDFGVATEADVAEVYRLLRMLRTAFWGMFALLFAASVAIFIFTIVVAKLHRQARRAAIDAKRLGQYTLDEKLGEGGMGVVYRAHHDMLARPTAVKFMEADNTNEQSIARFEREVQLTSRLVHPNTIAIFDYGRSPEGVFYYAMELLDGIELEDLVADYGPQPEGRVVNILRQVCGSLAEAHGVGLIHRDVKPANIVLNARAGLYDFVKLLDFGLVKAVDDRQQATLTSAGAMTGTPLYLSPEAIERPEDVDARSDLYAVGAVGYFLLTGTPVFDGGNVMEIIRSHADLDPQSPSERLGQPISAELEHLILRCLAKSPGDRPQSAKELAVALSACEGVQPWTDEEAAAWWHQFRPSGDANEFSSVTADGQLGATMIGPPSALQDR